MPLEEPIESSFVYFAEEILKFDLYPWQATAVTWFDKASTELVMGSIATPNGSGKSARIIPTVVLGWLMFYPKGRVVVTTADGKQIDSQIMPAIRSHRGKFPLWKFNEREIFTPAGGFFIAFSTDDKGRAEGYHKLDDDDGPLLIIVDEAKTVADGIFEAIDRCTYNALLLTSSPGHKKGRFYESQFGRRDFNRLAVGLKDCPHITKDKIDRLMEQYGPNGVTPNQSFLDSTLEGQFMDAETELRFNPDGLKRLTDMAANHDRVWRATVGQQPTQSPVGELVENQKGVEWLPDHRTGWAWIVEHPEPGLEYIGFADPMTGEQSEGARDRDSHAMGILRKGYCDRHGTLHDDEVVAVLHHEGGVRWHNDISAERLSLMLLYYGDCKVIVEANNSGTEVMRILSVAGRDLWLREKRDHNNPGKKLRVVGFQTNAATKNLWIGALGRAIREETLTCKYPLACSHFSTFILTDDGSGEAQPNCHDDYVTGVGLALFARESATKYPLPRIVQMPRQKLSGAWQ